MTSTPHPLLEKWVTHEIASESELRRIEQQLGIALPIWYRRFMTEIGCGEGYTERGCILLDPAKSLLDGIDVGAGRSLMSCGLFLFGSNGGGEAFTFAVHHQPCNIVMVPFVSDYRNDGIMLGSELEDLLDYANRFEYPHFKC